jgi:hypothetical protein
MKDNLYLTFYDPTKDFQKESRSFCYDLAADFIRQAKSISGKNWYEDINTVKGILLLLYTWNFAAKETKKLNFQNIRELIRKTEDDLIFLENYTIRTADNEAWIVIKRIFDLYKKLLGQTGTSKALSLLNPELFVMWDTAIRKRLKRELIPGIRNGERGEYYIKFLKGMQKIIEEYHIAKKLTKKSVIAKKVDEYNYVTIVKKRKK